MYCTVLNFHILSYDTYLRAYMKEGDSFCAHTLCIFRSYVRDSRPSSILRTVKYLKSSPLCTTRISFDTYRYRTYRSMNEGNHWKNWKGKINVHPKRERKIVTTHLSFHHHSPSSDKRYLYIKYFYRDVTSYFGNKASN